MQLSYIWKSFKAGGFKSFCNNVFQSPIPHSVWGGAVSLFVTANLVFAYGVNAKPSVQAQLLDSQHTTNVHLTDVVSAHSVEHSENTDYWTKVLSEILIARWQATEADPVDLKQELQRIARYYSQFPQVRHLLTSLDQYRWSLKFSEKRYSTEVFASRGSAYSVRVNFDPSSAARYMKNEKCAVENGYCVATPADVLLHELLHAHQILSDPLEFIKNHVQLGGGYPHEHEAHTIALEQNLYQFMSQVDNLPRPKRSEHAGMHVAVACAVCLK